MGNCPDVGDCGRLQLPMRGERKETKMIVWLFGRQVLSLHDGQDMRRWRRILGPVRWLVDRLLRGMYIQSSGTIYERRRRVLGLVLNDYETPGPWGWGISPVLDVEYP